MYEIPAKAVDIFIIDKEIVKMKKLIALLLSIVMVMSLAACGADAVKAALGK